MRQAEEEPGRDIRIWHLLYLLEARHWDDVNRNQGRRAHEFYTEDGIFAVGDTRHEGREKIRHFYTWRASRGPRTARHLVSNFEVLTIDDDSAQARGIVTLYGADGAPILPSRPPTMVADLACEYERGSDGEWRFRSHILTPLFRGEGRLGGSEGPRSP